MFERFGIIDIWYGFIKRKKIMLTVLLFGFGLILLRFALNFIKSGSDSGVSFDDVYVSSISYYVEPNDEVLGISDSNLYKSMPDDYLAVLNTDFCRQYIFEKLTSEYENKFIVENSGLNMSSFASNPEKMGIDAMKELYVAKKYSNSMLFEVTSMTYSKELSQSVRDICQEFLESNLGTQVKNSSVKLAGKADRISNQTEIASENTDKNDKRNIIKVPESKKITLGGIIKRVIIPTILVVILCILYIVVMDFFNPKLNQISDFAEYDVPVIGEINDYKNMKGME